MSELQALSATEAQQQFDELLERVGDHNQVAMLTRGDRQSIVLMSASDYESLLETVHLLKSPANASRLHEAIGQLKAGGGTERELLQ